jgi:nicotinate-nucleotide adenylyltransferase
VLPRSGHEILDGAWVGTRFPGRESRIRLLPGPLLPISGSVVRSRVAAGRSIRYLVPDAVARYITDHALYTANSMRTPAT